MLDVVVCGLAFQLNQRRRYRKNAANLLSLELARLNELRFLRCDGNAVVFEAKRQELGASQQRKYCRENYLSFPRMREWREMHRQLLLVCRDQGLKVNREKAEYSAVHRSLLTGLLGHVSLKSGEHDYQGARNRKQFIFPGSSQFSRKPKWIMSAELVETSKLFARMVAKVEPESSSRWQ